MMQFFRSAAKPIILVTTIAFFVWLVYDLSGLGNGGGLLTKTSVGKVNGTTVDARRFTAAVQQATEARQRQTGASLSLEDVAQVRDQVWEQFIQDIIFRAEYDRHGLRVTPDEIAEAIRVQPLQEVAQSAEFQTDGRFDLSKYQRWLSSSSGQANVPFLEDRYREELLRGKLLRRVIGDVFVSDAALWERYQDGKEQVTVGELSIDPALAITDQAAPVTPADIDNYYRDHRDEFKRPKAAFMSYIALPRLPDASDTVAALSRAGALHEEIATGAPFADVARRESADTISGKRGGELGEMARSAVDSSFAAAAMTLPLNKLSGPVKSAAGFHLIEVTSRKTDKFTARHLLVPIEVTGSHRDLLDRRADSLEQLAAERLEPSALDTAAAALRLDVHRAGPIGEGIRIQLPEGGGVPDASIWAFQAKPGEESPVIEAERAYVVFRLDSVQLEGVPPIAAIRSDVEQRARLARKRAAGRELGTKLTDQARSGTALKQLAQGPGIAYRELGPFTRLGSALREPTMIGAAFAADKGAVAGPVVGDDGIHLYEGIARIPADSADFVKNISQLRTEAQQAARQGRVRAYVTALRAAAIIVDRRSDVYLTGAQAAAAAQVPVR